MIRFDEICPQVYDSFCKCSKLFLGTSDIYIQSFGAQAMLNSYINSGGRESYKNIPFMVNTFIIITVPRCLEDQVIDMIME